MPTPHVPTPESLPKTERFSPSERASSQAWPEVAPRRPLPRAVPPPLGPPPAPRAPGLRGLVEVYLPPLFLGLLALVFVGSAASLLWTASSPDDDLTPEEIRVLEEAARSHPAAARASDLRLASGVGSGAATLQVATTPPGALVSIDGVVVGVTPLRLRRLPNRHYVVSLERAGFRVRDTLVYLGEGEPAAVSMALEPAFEEEAGPAPMAVPDPVPPVASEAAEAEPPPPADAPGSIGVLASPAGVAVELDGRPVGVAPLELGDVAAGPHTLTLSHPGHETATVRVDVEAGARAVVEAALAPQTGTLTVVVRPWGSIYVDGVLRARDTDVSFEALLPVGRHQVRVEHPGLGAQERTVEVHPDRSTALAFDLN